MWTEEQIQDIENRWKPDYEQIAFNRRQTLKKLVFEVAKKLGGAFMCSTPLSMRLLYRQTFPLRPKKNITLFVRECIKQYEIDKPWPKIRVRFIKLLGHPAHVIQNGTTWDIEIDPKYKWKKDALVAIIAHEVAHVVLGKKQLQLSPKQLNEELTDTTAILGGFGRAMLAATYIEDNFLDHTHIERLGYLRSNEIKHLGKIKQYISQGRPIKKFYPVYLSAKREIDCYSCSQKLKIPENKIGKGIIKCPICQMKQLVTLKSKEYKNYGIIKKLLTRTVEYFQRKIDFINGF